MASLSRLGVVAGFLAVAALCLPLADLTVAGHDPWTALARMGRGFLAPDFGAIEQIARAVALTVAFAVAGVTLGGVAGLILAGRFVLRPLADIAPAWRHPVSDMSVGALLARLPHDPTLVRLKPPAEDGA